MRINESVLRFREALETGAAHSHRSGLRGQSAAFNGLQTPLSATVAQDIAELQVFPLDRSPSHVAALADRLGLPPRQEQAYDPVDDLIRFRISGATDDLSWQALNGCDFARSKEYLLGLAQELAGIYFASYDQDAEFANEEVETVNDCIVRLTVRYRRIVSGAIILGNTSYLSLTVDGTGDLVGVDVKWPSLEPVYGTERTITYAEAQNEAVEEFKRGRANAPNLDRMVTPTKVYLEGAALAWREVEAGNKRLLTPRFAFKAVCSYSDGEDIPSFVDIPRLVKRRETMVAE